MTRLTGGGSFWVKLPVGVSALALAEHAKTRGVLIEPGDVFFNQSAGNGHFVRLGFQSISASVIDSGVAEFAKALTDIRR